MTIHINFITNVELATSQLCNRHANSTTGQLSIKAHNKAALKHDHLQGSASDIPDSDTEVELGVNQPETTSEPAAATFTKSNAATRFQSDQFTSYIYTRAQKDVSISAYRLHRPLFTVNTKATCGSDAKT
jgi:hypothetical protein